MGDKNRNLQDLYLNSLRKEKIPVVIYLTNGVRLKGVIKGFDNFVVLLNPVRKGEALNPTLSGSKDKDLSSSSPPQRTGFSNGAKQEKQQLIYKHAISTIIPEKDVDIKSEAPAES